MSFADEEFYYCNTCEENGCDCGGGFYWYDSLDDIEVECPCCGSMDVQV